MGLLLLDVPGLIVIQHPIGEAIRAHGDLAHAGLSLEHSPLRQGLGPVSNVHTGFGPLSAPDITRSAVVTRIAPIIWAGENGGIRRPPVPAQFLEALNNSVAELAEGQRRHLAGGFGWIGRVAGD